MTRIWFRAAGAAALAGLLLVTAGYPQPPVPQVSPDPLNALPPVAAPVAKPVPTVDELIATLESLKKQREALDKQEKAVAEQLRDRLKEQQDRLAKLGLNQPRAEPKPPETPKIDLDAPPLIPDPRLPPVTPAPRP